MLNQIQMIPIDRLEPHPENPRKDVGDVTELADSIRHSGIMQNLTVVPFGDKYRVVIGHRRLAAAKEAGLSELPCMVSDMDYREQCATMLAENMQRTDLTVPEQVQGVQLLLNLGETVDEISKKTGFSASTVKKRVKLATLPVEEFKAADERGGTLEEYVKCMEIEDEEKRAELLDLAGSRDFEWRFDNAKNAQETEKKFPEVKAFVEQFAKPFKNDSDRYASNINNVKVIFIPKYKSGDIDLTEFDPKKKYFYRKALNQVLIYEKVKSKKKTEPKKSPKEIKADEMRAELKRLSENCAELRAKFLDALTVTKENREVLFKWILIFSTLKDFCYYSGDRVIILKAVKKYQFDKNGFVRPNEIKKMVEDDKNAAVYVFRLVTPNATAVSFFQNNYNDTMPTYRKDEKLEMLYAALEELGYKTGTEEQSLVDGTHEIFHRAEKEKK